MLKQELVEKISKYFKLSPFESEKIIQDIFNGIIEGVKTDKIVNLNNFGEFIVKYNGKGKSVEFLPASKMEDEINQIQVFDIIESQTSYPPVIENIQDVKVKESTLNEPVIKEGNEMKAEIIPPVIDEKPTQKDQDDSFSNTSIEDEMKRKREEILRKIHIPHSFSAYESEEKVTEISKPIIEETSKIIEEIKDKVIETPEIKYELKKNVDFVEEDTTKLIQEIKPEIPVKHDPEIETVVSNIVDVESNKNFSDYFSVIDVVKKDKIEDIESKVEEKTVEIKEIPQVIDNKIEEVVEQQTVIPKSAVELHNEIIGAGQFVEQPKEKEVEEDTTTKHQAEDSSYYIWYKDSEASPTETQTLSYEYELLYQAQKEAEYKSKLKIYVTTFILFFSFVLILLIFSPVIYKIFFTPTELQKVETVPDESNYDNGAIKQTPVIVDTAKKDTTKVVVTPPVQENQQQQTQQQEQLPPKQEQRPPQKEQVPPPKQEQVTPPPQKVEQKTETVPPNTEHKVEGLVKTSLGWMDEKYKVIYILLENNKYTIQESAWDSDVKAQKRLKAVESMNLSGLKGSIIKVDLADKGIWYRARFGEFSSLDEARKKVQEMRDKEKTKLQAMLLLFLLYT
jgi:hypothetical protein